MNETSVIKREEMGVDRPIDIESLFRYAMDKGGVETVERLMVVRRELNAEKAKAALLKNPLPPDGQPAPDASVLDVSVSPMPPGTVVPGAPPPNIRRAKATAAIVTPSLRAFASTLRCAY